MGRLLAARCLSLAAFHKARWDAWTRTVREQGLKFD